ncbi:MAG: hypothetical protein ACR2NN_08700, partial [Bryobacteraceae bacterium]
PKAGNMSQRARTKFLFRMEPHRGTPALLKPGEWSRRFRLPGDQKVAIQVSDTCDGPVALAKHVLLTLRFFARRDDFATVARTVVLSCCLRPAGVAGDPNTGSPGRRQSPTACPTVCGKAALCYITGGRVCGPGP